MKDYIERTTAIEAFTEAERKAACPGADFPVIKRILANLPAADVMEVRHGKWVFNPGKIPYCSECKEYSDDGDKGATICPWCGAHMNKEK